MLSFWLILGKMKGECIMKQVLIIAVVLLSESSITGRSDVGKTEQEKGVRKRWRLDMQRTSRNPVNIVISGMKRKRNAGR